MNIFTLLKKNYLFLFLVFIAMMIIVPAIHAQEYYAHVTFTIQENGLVEISGIRNHPEMQINSTQQFTSKSGDYWISNITFSQNFSVYAYTLVMPKDSVINYIKSNTPVKISTVDKTTVLLGSGENKPLEIVIQYSFEKNGIQELQGNIQKTGTIFFIVIMIGIVIVIVVLAFFFTIINKKRKINNLPWYHAKIISERQKQIITILEEKGTVSQRYLEKELQIPKSSLSRNIDSLQQKGIISKESTGMTNMVQLNKQKPEIQIPAK